MMPEEDRATMEAEIALDDECVVWDADRYEELGSDDDEDDDE